MEDMGIGGKQTPETVSRKRVALRADGADEGRVGRVFLKPLS